MPLVDKSRAKPQPPAPVKDASQVTEIVDGLETLKTDNPAAFSHLHNAVTRVAKPLTPLQARMRSKKPQYVRPKPIVARREQVAPSPFRQMYDGTLKPSVDHHAKLWSGCTACGLCQSRKNVVLWRGHLPAQVLFIGEGPGESEDTLGKPFVGPAGRLLDRIIEESGFQAFGSKTLAYSWCITNVVACQPLTPQGKNRAPKRDESEACFRRLLQFIHLAQPKLIVTVGATARDFVTAVKVPRLETFPPGRNWVGWSTGVAPVKLGKQKPGMPEVNPDKPDFKLEDTHSIWTPAFQNIMHPSSMLRAKDTELEVKRAVTHLVAKLRTVLADDEVPF